jgi:hypothetical protein
MTAMVNVPWPPIRIFADHVLPLPRVRLGNPRELRNVRYQTWNLARRGAKSIDHHLGSSLCLAPSAIAVWRASESMGFGETALLDSTLRQHPVD